MSKTEIVVGRKTRSGGISTGTWLHEHVGFCLSTVPFEIYLFGIKAVQLNLYV